VKIGLLNLAIELIKNQTFKDVKSVMDMGNKSLRVHYDDLKYLYDQTNIKFDSNKFNFLKKFPKGNRRSMRLFWESLGITNYKSIDINNRDGSIFFDLNLPFNEKKHIGKYDLVIDIGNNEHIFNVGEAYKTMFNLCRKNGFLWIFQAVYNGNGFFQFDIPFFEGLALANKLGVVYSAYVIGTSDYDQYLIPASKDLFNTLDLTKIKTVDITYILRKQTTNDFKFFYQYNLKKKSKFYKISFLSKRFPPERYYIPSKSIEDIVTEAKKKKKDSLEWIRATGKNK